MSVDSRGPTNKIGTPINLAWFEVLLEFVELAHRLEYSQKCQFFH
jgi:hypothetical protein